MKRTWIIVLVILGIIFLGGCSSYNGLVDKQVEVEKEWGNVQTQYQRRADVLINLMETVKGAAANEKDILTAVTNARAGITEAKEAMKEAKSPAELNLLLQKVQASASSIKLTFEAYPTIRSTEAFLKFQDEIAGTENRISTVRERYNGVVGEYNKSTRKFPTVIFAKLFGFDAKEFFEADKGAEDAPKIKF